MPLLGGGFTIQTQVPIDDRFIRDSAVDRFSITTFFNGLTVYSTGSNEYFIVVDRDETSTNVGWRQLPTHYVTSSVAAISSTTSLYTITTGS